MALSSTDRVISVPIAIKRIDINVCGYDITIYKQATFKLRITLVGAIMYLQCIIFRHSSDGSYDYLAV